MAAVGLVVARFFAGRALVAGRAAQLESPRNILSYRRLEQQVDLRQRTRLAAAGDLGAARLADPRHDERAGERFSPRARARKSPCPSASSTIGAIGGDSAGHFAGEPGFDGGVVACGTHLAAFRDRSPLGRRLGTSARARHRPLLLGQRGGDRAKGHPPGGQGRGAPHRRAIKHCARTVWRRRPRRRPICAATFAGEIWTKLINRLCWIPVAVLTGATLGAIAERPRSSRSSSAS